MNFLSDVTDMGLSAGSLDTLIIESRRGGMRSLTLSSLRASLKVCILAFSSWMAAGVVRSEVILLPLGNMC